MSKQNSNKGELEWVKQSAAEMQIDIINLNIKDSDSLALFRDINAMRIYESETPKEFDNYKDAYLFVKDKTITCDESDLECSRYQGILNRRLSLSFTRMNLSNGNNGILNIDPKFSSPDAYYIDHLSRKTVGYEEFKVTCGELIDDSAVEMKTKSVAKKALSIGSDYYNGLKDDDIIKYLIDCEDQFISASKTYEINLENLYDSLSYGLEKHLKNINKYISNLESLNSKDYEVSIVFVVDMSTCFIPTVIRYMPEFNRNVAGNYIDENSMIDIFKNNYELIKRAIETKVNNTNLKLAFIIPKVRYIDSAGDIDFWEKLEFRVLYLDNIEALDNHLKLAPTLSETYFGVETLPINIIDTIYNIPINMHGINGDLYGFEDIWKIKIGKSLSPDSIFATKRNNSKYNL